MYICSVFRQRHIHFVGSAIPNHHLEDNEPTMIRAYAYRRRRFYIIMELVVSLGWRGNDLRLLLELSLI